MTTLAIVESNPSDYSAAEARRVREEAAVKRAVVLPPTRPGETGILRNPKTPGGPAQWQKDKVGKPSTVWQVFQQGKARAGNGTGPLFGTKQGNSYTYESYNEGEANALAFGTALLNLGLKSGKDMVGIMLNNSRYWYTADIAALAYNFVSVPLYTTGDDEFTLHICNMCDLPLVILKGDNLARMIKLRASNKTPTVRHLVLVDYEPTAADHASAKAAGILLHTFDGLIAQGRKNPAKPTPATDENAPWSIISTSGTTGNPKGSILTHGNIAFATHVFTFDPEWTIDPKSDIWFSYLPSAHAADRLCSWSFMGLGVPLAFGSGNVAELFNDLQASKPTMIVMVPRILNRVVAQIKTMVDAQGPEARKAFDEGYKAKRKLLLESGTITRDSEWDRKVFAKFQAILGGRMRYVSAGAAAVDVNALEFGRIVFGCQFQEAFGQTEGSAITSMTTVNAPYTPFGSTVGRPYSYMDVKLIDVPELGYTANDKPYPRGEILVRGPNVCAGYYREPKKTAETIDEEGYLHMGDVAEILPDGTFRIIDRAKNVFKLNQGEFVAPEKVETVVSRSSWIGQIFVYGEIRERWLVAVIVPDPERVTAWAKANNKPGSFPDLCKDPQLTKLVHEDIEKVGKANGLLGFEIPKAIVLSPAPFTAEEGLITASLKNKRNALKDKYNNELRAMYASIQD